MTVKERLSEYIIVKRIAVSTFEARCGLSNGYIKNLKSNPSAIKLEDILNAYPDINRIWLLTGEGEMLNSECPNNKNIIPATTEHFNVQIIIETCKLLSATNKTQADIIKTQAEIIKTLTSK